jgi:hypothetical protein
MGIRSVGVLCNHIWSIVENGLGRAKTRVRAQTKIWGSTRAEKDNRGQLPKDELICRRKCLVNANRTSADQRFHMSDKATNRELTKEPTSSSMN